MKNFFTLFLLIALSGTMLCNLCNATPQETNSETTEAPTIKPQFKVGDWAIYEKTSSNNSCLSTSTQKMTIKESNNEGWVIALESSNVKIKPQGPYAAQLIKILNDSLTISLEIEVLVQTNKNGKALRIINEEEINKALQNLSQMCKNDNPMGQAINSIIAPIISSFADSEVYINAANTVGELIGAYGKEITPGASFSTKVPNIGEIVHKYASFTPGTKGSGAIAAFNGEIKFDTEKMIDQYLTTAKQQQPSLDIDKIKNDKATMDQLRRNIEQNKFQSKTTYELYPNGWVKEIIDENPTTKTVTICVSNSWNSK